MTTDEIMRAMAERDGWEFRNYRQNEEGDAVFVLYKDGRFIGDRNWMGAIRAGVPDYLNSKDAIVRVLEKLTEEEWKRLHDAIWNRWFDVRDGETLTAKSEVAFILAMPAAELALCVAEAIKPSAT